MPQKTFFLQLGIVTILAAAAVFLLHRLPALQAYGLLSWIALLFFVLFCTAMYYAGARSARSDNKNDFTNTFLGFTVGKMFLAVIIIYGYLQLAQPQDKRFILPFFGVYLIYTIFEVYFMSRLGKMNA